jgi:hypothetical protein
MNTVKQTKTIGIRTPVEIHKQIGGIAQANGDLNKPSLNGEYLFKFFIDSAVSLENQSNKIL